MLALFLRFFFIGDFYISLFYIFHFFSSSEKFFKTRVVSILEGGLLLNKNGGKWGSQKGH